MLTFSACLPSAAEVSRHDDPSALVSGVSQSVLTRELAPIMQVADVLDVSGIDFEEARRELLDESESQCSLVGTGGVSEAVVDGSGSITFASTGSSSEVAPSVPAHFSPCTTHLFRHNRHSLCELLICRAHGTCALLDSEIRTLRK